MNINEQAINDAMASGDLDALERLMGEFEELEVTDGDPDTEDTKVETPDETVVEPAPTAATEETPVQKTEEAAPPAEAGKAVLSKDGKHLIPYDVLEATRTKVTNLTNQLQELQQAAGERDQLKAVLEKHGIDLNAETGELTEEALAEIAEDFPSFSKPLTKMMNELTALKQQLAQLQQPVATANPIRDAFESIPELMQWETADKDRLDYAVLTDKALMSDPLWSTRPIRDRFVEAVRRTQSAFGDAIQPAAKPEPAKTPAKPVTKEDTLPGSPSEVGNGVRETATKGTPEYYASLSPEELQNQMAHMSPAEVERLLSAYDL